MTLLPCPWCGETPKELYLREGSTHRWAMASPACCGAVEGEIRRESRYYQDFSDADMALAIAWWNDRKPPPATERIQELEARVKKLEFENECLANAGFGDYV